jgi:hypothetical protein
MVRLETSIQAAEVTDITWPVLDAMLIEVSVPVPRSEVAPKVGVLR